MGRRSQDCASSIFLLVMVVLIEATFSGNITDFPLSQYFSEKYDATDPLLEYRATCPGKDVDMNSIPPRMRPCCSCKPDCMKYKHCCIDFLWPNYTSFTRNASVEGYKQYLTRESLNYKETICLNVTNFPVAQVKVLMVATCPKDIFPGTKEQILCEREGIMGSRSPAPVLGEDGYLYRNVYCARCNSVKNFTVLNLYFQCNSLNVSLLNETIRADDDIFKVLSDCTASVEWTRTKWDLPVCQDYDVYDTPDVTQSPRVNTSDLCNSYSATTYLGDKRYKNVDCIRDTSPQAVDGMQVACGFVTVGVRILGIPRFSLLISLQDVIEVQVRETESNDTIKFGYSSCNSELNDVFPGSCVPVTCGPAYVRSGNQCIFKEIEPRVSSNIEKLKHCIAAQNGGLYFEKMKKTESSMDVVVSILHKNSVNYQLVASAPQSSSKSNFVLLGVLDSVSSINATLLVAQEDLEIFEHVSNIYISSNNDLFISRHFQDNQQVLRTLFPRSKLCAKPHELDPNLVNISTSCSLVSPNGVFDITKYVSWLHMNMSTSVEVALFVCDGFYQQHCRGVWQVHENYTVWPDLSVTTTDGKHLEFYQYLPVQNGIKICQNKAPDVGDSWRISVEAVEAYVTLSGIVLSMLAYIWVIVTFLYFKEFRNNPGRCLVSLCFSLLISDILFLSQLSVTNDSNSCKVLAVLNHYFQLSTYTWAAVITFDITHTFLDGVVLKNHRNDSVFRMYSLAAWFSSFLLVAFGIVLDEAHVVQVYGWFGGLCWIKSLEVRIALYILPGQAVIVGCFTSLAITLFQISKQQKMISEIVTRNKTERLPLTKMAFKLVIVLGLVEIVGLVQVSNTSTVTVQKALSVFQVLFSFLRGFRGVFIWTFYILLNKTAWLLYKGTYVSRRYPQASVSVHAMLKDHAESST